MKQYTSMFPNESFLPHTEAGGKKFFTKNHVTLTPHLGDKVLLKVQWCAFPEKNGTTTLTMVVHGLNQCLLNEFVGYYATKLGLKPIAVPVEMLRQLLSDAEAASIDGAVAKQDADSQLAMGKGPSLKLAERRRMLEDINRLIEANLENENFRVNDLARGLNYCIMQVHRIIKELTDFSSAHYIRRYRLEKGRSLLATGQYNVNEVAYKVGYKSPEHFSRSFKQEFGECPSGFRSSALP